MKIAIIGAGAAGCFAAANMGVSSAHTVTVYEKSAKLLQKVKVSGGGRCNVTHACFDIPELLTFYPRGKSLLRKILYRFGPADTVDWFAQRGVKIKQEEDGRMFPVADDSQTIINCLLQAMERNRVQVECNRGLIRLEKEDNGFTLEFAGGHRAFAHRVLIACGGFPKAEQYHWLTALGHSIEQPVPSLFTFNLPGHPITRLMGISVPDATVKISGTKLSSRGPLLITHWGMSGPAVLRTSAWAARELHDRKYVFTISINWLGNASQEEVKQQLAELRRGKGSQFMVSSNPFSLPRRLWEFQLQACGISHALRWADLPAALQNKLEQCLVNDTYAVNGKTTFKEEFVTCGGIKLAEVNADTMESRIVPGLYFAGEILDADGITGGFNFQHAWASGWVAAQSLSSSGG